MSKTISHSALTTYRECPRKYKEHYISRLRSPQIGSALHFGGCLDEVLNRLLGTKMDNPPENATDNLEELKNEFDHRFAFVQIKTEIEDVRASHFIEYYGSDFDPNLLDESDYATLGLYIKNAGYDENDPVKLYNFISDNIKKKLNVAPTDLAFYNYCSWRSMRQKAHRLLEVYAEQVMPKIKKVTSIQKKVELPDGNGTTLIGYIDLEAEFHDEVLEEFDLEGIGEITVDNKTSSPKYKLPDINDKGQLLIYDEYTGNGYGAYIVLLKKPKYTKEKTCQICGTKTVGGERKCKVGGKDRCNGEFEVELINPVFEFQILIDKIDEEKKDLLFDEICDIMESIENEEFPENRDSCFNFGRKCQYWDLCREGSSEGLDKV